MIEIERLLSVSAESIQKDLVSLLPKGEDRLSKAMRYSTLSMGKRLRPFMLVTTADMFKVDPLYSKRVAAVIEIIHSYSLIHDDLPAMDDDDYRRGNPSCHKKFDEATAILAGDSLLTLAFEILAEEATHPDSLIRCKLIKILAENIGYNGIAGGQMYDLLYEREMSATYQEMLNMHWMKTARLFIASCSMGAILGGASLDDHKHLIKYAEFFGLAFQFVDDLEDISEKKELSNNNIVKLIGLEETKKEIKGLIDKARKELLNFSGNAQILDSIALQLLQGL